MIRLKVFISSVQKELRQERLALGAFLATDDFLSRCTVPRLFEEYPAPLQPDKKAYLELVRACQVYLLVIGEQYGNPTDTGISAVHEEYRLAQSLRLPTLVCVKGDAGFAREPAEAAFLEEVRSAGHTYSRFQSIDDLLTVARARLGEFLVTTFDTGPTPEQDVQARETRRAAAPFERQVVHALDIVGLDEELTLALAAGAEDRPAEKLSQDDVRQALLSRGYLWFDARGAIYRPTAAAVLLLARSPATAFPQARMQLDAYAGRVPDASAIDSVLLDAPLPRAIEQAVAFVRRNSRQPLRVEGLHRVSGDVLPQEALREAIANAAAHRDYEDAGAKIVVEVFSDRVVVASPGLPPGEQRLDLIARGEGRSRARNPLVVQGLTWLELMDERGSGIRRMRAAMQRQGLPLPRFAEAGDEVRVTLETANAIVPSGQASVPSPGGGADALRDLPVTERQREILAQVLAAGFVTTGSCVRELGIAKDTAWRYLSELIEKGLLVRTGSGRASRYSSGPVLDRLIIVRSSDANRTKEP